MKSVLRTWTINIKFDWTHFSFLIIPGLGYLFTFLIQNEKKVGRRWAVWWALIGSKIKANCFPQSKQSLIFQFVLFTLICSNYMLQRMSPFQRERKGGGGGGLYGFFVKKRRVFLAQVFWSLILGDLLIFELWFIHDHWTLAGRFDLILGGKVDQFNAWKMMMTMMRMC